MIPGLSDHAARLRDLIDGSSCLDLAAGASQFKTIALDLFAFQFEQNAAYRQLCRSRQVRPERVSDWPQIPSVPASAFKEFDLTCLRPEARTRVFCSSGTTGQPRSRHFHSAESLALYETSLRAWFGSALLRDPCEKLRCVFLTPPPSSVPTSSLVHMFETVRRAFASPDSIFVGRVETTGDWSLDVDALVAALGEGQKADPPLMLLGTAFNFVHLLDALTARRLRFHLPPGSRVMETGGYKGRSRSLSKDELHAGIAQFLGLARAHIVCEYGMCELSSQAYDLSFAPSSPGPPVTRQFRFPPWVRFLVISPETGQPVGHGERGLLRVFDLANVASVLVVQTEDRVIQREKGFELLGRAGLTEPRGCSLMSV